MCVFSNCQHWKLISKSVVCEIHMLLFRHNVYEQQHSATKQWYQCEKCLIFHWRHWWVDPLFVKALKIQWVKEFLSTDEHYYSSLASIYVTRLNYTASFSGATATNGLTLSRETCLTNQKNKPWLNAFNVQNRKRDEKVERKKNKRNRFQFKTHS